MKDNRKKFTKIISYVQSLKEKTGLVITDTHIHPFDVMGIVHYHAYKLDEVNNLLYKTISSDDRSEKYFVPGILETFRYGRNASLLARPYFKYLSKSVKKSIETSYKETGENRLLKELSISLIDRAVLLPVEPWLTTKEARKYFNDKRFLLLGSIDIHHIKVNMIKEKINEYVKEYNIVGIKLHPNLQDFKPQPHLNPPEIAEKLRIIYQEAVNNNLYLLFHGGLSYYTKNVNLKYKNFSRSKSNALLKYFCDPDGKSELFGKYNVPIVIAHLGHYGLVKPNYRLIEIIARNYSNVFFDTAGVSPLLLRKTIEIISSKKIIFGSDALYNRIIYNLLFLFYAAGRARTDESTEDILLNILGLNYNSKVLKR